MKIKIFYCLSFLLLNIALDTSALILKNDTSGISGSGTLSGTITDKQDGKPIQGAAIFIPDLRKGVVTDANGKYVINNLPKGIYLVQVSFLGYATYNQKIDFSKLSSIDLQLQVSSLEAGEVVVTGVSKATESKREPVPMVAAGKPYIEQQAASGNIIDAIANLPGISAVTTGPNISKPFIHGLGYNRVITLEDGIRQEGQQWGDEHGIEVDQNSIDRVEIIKGPASLAYGSDAIGGVVNLLTALPVAEGQILGSVQGVYGTNNGLINGSFKIQGNQKGIVWGTTLSLKMAKDFQNQHDGLVYATGFQEKDARVMAGVNKQWGYSYLNASLFDDLQDIPDGSRDSARHFTYQITDIDTFRPKVPVSVLNSYAIPVLHQHVQLYRVYDNSNISLGGGNFIVNLGYQFSHRREFTHPQNATVPGLNLQLTTLSYDVKYNYNIENVFETTVGVNGMYQNNALGTNSTDFPIPAYNLFDIGPFLIITKNIGKLDISAGVRFDNRSFSEQAAYIDTIIPFFPAIYNGPNPATATNVVSQFPALTKDFSGVSGSFGATYNFSDVFLIKGNLARGYRSPSIAELSANGADPGSQIYHVGNPDFKPEFSFQEDLGVFFTLPDVSGSVELYNNTIQNYIFQEQILDANGLPERVNPNGEPNPKGIYSKFMFVQSTALINGGEFNLDIHFFPWLHFANSLTLTYGTNVGAGDKMHDSLKYLPFIPPLHTHSELRGSFSKGFSLLCSLYAYMGFDHFNAQDRFFAAYGTETYTSGYNLISGGIGANIVNRKGNTVFKLFIEGTNLANVSYQSNMSRLKYFDNPVVPGGIQPGIFNMGRNISFKIIVPFDASKHTKSDNIN